MNYEYISMNTIEENNKLLGEVERLRNEKQELLETIDMITNDASKYVKRIDEAIEYIEEKQIQNEYTDRCGFRVKENKWWLEDSDILLNILKGEK